MCCKSPTKKITGRLIVFKAFGDGSSVQKMRKSVGGKSDGSSAGKRRKGVREASDRSSL
jgi:hypothetical protein